jgi:hypothetical protein
MKWYNAVRDFLYVHSWLQGLIFGSLVAVIGGGSFLHRRKERQHARDLVDATRKLAEANQEANQYRAELLKAHKEFAATMQPEKEKIRPRLLQQKGKNVMFLRESYRGSYEPSIQILVDVNEDSIILRGSGTGNQPTASWPLVKVTTETDAEGRFMVVFDDSAKPRR